MGFLLDKVSTAYKTAYSEGNYMASKNYIKANYFIKIAL